MKVKKFHVNGQSVTGNHKAKRGKDSIKVKGASSYEVYAYVNGENKCEMLIGHSHIGLNKAWKILDTADVETYSIGTQASPSGEPTNGTLHVGSHGEGDDGDAGDEDAAADDDDDDDE